jgi:hypothetical protein
VTEHTGDQRALAVQEAHDSSGKLETRPRV